VIDLSYIYEALLDVTFKGKFKITKWEFEKMPDMTKPVYLHEQDFFTDWLKLRKLEWPKHSLIEQENIMARWSREGFEEYAKLEKHAEAIAKKMHEYLRLAYQLNRDSAYVYGDDVVLDLKAIGLDGYVNLVQLARVALFYEIEASDGKKEIS